MLRYFVLLLMIVTFSISAQIQQFTVPILDSQGAATDDTVTVNATVSIVRGSAPPPPDPVSNGNLLGALENYIIDEREQLIATLPITESGARVFIENIPPGLTFNEATREIRFFPDFTQSGDYTVNVTAYGATETDTGAFTIRVNNTITPPDPVVTSVEPVYKATIHHITLTSDGFLDPPGLAGTEYDLGVTVPDDASVSNKRPLRIHLHGTGGIGGHGKAGLGFSFGPYEPFVGWHTGQHSDYPGAATASTTVPNTTQRKALHILDWITRTFPGVDRDQVSISGTSMGGSGSNFFSVRYGYHISEAISDFGMTSILQSSQGQQDALETYWGPRGLELDDDLGMSVWDRFDLPRALRDNENARNVFYTGFNGVTDGLLKFHHFSTNSPITGESFASALQNHSVGHRIYWDQSGHGSADPGIELFWQGARATEAKVYRNKAFPAFSNSSLDKDPPLFNSGTQTFTGNDPRGGRNRHLAWVTDSIVDEHENFSIPLFVVTQPVDPDQDSNLPVAGEGHPGAFPVTVDVTLRRVQRFKGLPGEVIDWTFGAQSGQLTVAANGDIKITGLNLTAAQQTLSLSRTL